MMINEAKVRSDWEARQTSKSAAVVNQRADRSIVLKNVGKIFNTQSGQVTALSNVDLAIESGQFVSIVGPSGCGKSTLMRIVAGLMPATSGSVQVGGHKIVKPYTDLGIVFQRDLLMESRTALENILLQIEMRGLNKKDYVAKAHELLERVNLAGFANKYPREMSGGMRQRVGICRAMIHNPPVMLMDEPFGALDALTRDEITADLAALCESDGKTVLFITHSINEAIFLSDRVIVMTARPARIAMDIPVNIARPRSNLSEQDAIAFANHGKEIRSLLLSKANQGKVEVI
ncbi:MAG: ABC transporter ATP-binding protein [Gammaproteobacteria bacterium]